MEHFENKLCLVFPQIHTIGFHLIFTIGIPLYLLYNDVNLLKYYLPILVALAVTATEYGKPDFFNDLYNSDCNINDSFTSFLSKNLINTLAIVGLLLNCISLALVSNNLILGLVTGIIIYFCTFVLAAKVLPKFVRLGYEKAMKLEINGNRLLSPNAKLPKLFLGLLFICAIIAFEYILFVAVVPSLLSNSSRNNLKNNLI